MVCLHETIADYDLLRIFNKKLTPTNEFWKQFLWCSCGLKSLKRDFRARGICGWNVTPEPAPECHNSVKLQGFFVSKFCAKLDPISDLKAFSDFETSRKLFRTLKNIKNPPLFLAPVYTGNISYHSYCFFLHCAVGPLDPNELSFSSLIISLVFSDCTPRRCTMPLASA